MSSVVGYVTALAQVGLSAVLVKPKRSIGAFVAQVVIEESHEDSLEITEHPVEQGTSVADHAFKQPAVVTIKAAWSNSPSRSGLIDGVVGGLASTKTAVQSILAGTAASQVRDVYERLLKLQSQAEPFDVFTGKRKYTNMLIQRLMVTTDQKTENMLMVTATCRQVLIARTTLVSVPADSSKQASPQATAAPVNMGVKSLLPGNTFSNAGAGRGFVNPPVVTP